MDEKPFFKCVTSNPDVERPIASVHVGEKPYECSNCSFKTTQLDNLKKHNARIHEKKKPFNCSICNKDFFEKKNLLNHTAVVHEGIKPQKNSTMFDL